LLTLHAGDPARFERALDSLGGAVEIGESYEPRPLVIDRVTA
jgi:thymidine phosphorylase